jgi:hypothetical protein
MTHIHDYITWYSLLFILLGWYLYVTGLLIHLATIKGKLVGYVWLFTNRPLKMQRSIITGCIAGLIAYVYFDPSGLDISATEQRKDFAIYLMYMTGIGGSSTFLFDVGMDALARSRGVDMTKRTNYSENGETVIIRPDDKDAK